MPEDKKETVTYGPYLRGWKCGECGRVCEAWNGWSAYLFTEITPPTSICRGCGAFKWKEVAAREKITSTIKTTTETKSEWEVK